MGRGWDGYWAILLEIAEEEEEEEGVKKGAETGFGSDRLPPFTLSSLISLHSK